ncbi:MAG: hypothetical protein ACE5F9_14425 [Phycisphaerae bacterium]
MSDGGRRLMNDGDPNVALASLCEPFSETAGFPFRYELLGGCDLPSPFHDLLVHHDHMTTVLRAYHGQALTLRALSARQSDETYSRAIVLAAANGQEIVEFGIVRMNLACVDEAVRSAILEAKVPLGEILIRHEVLRRIEPRCYLRLPEACGPLKRADRPCPTAAYGRIGTIYCNHEPAIELLEVVPDAQC